MATTTGYMTVDERGYTDLHEHIEELRAKGLLIEIDREINKDTEMHPLVRWQFRGGIDEERMTTAIEQTKSVYEFSTEPEISTYFDGSYLPAADLRMLQ